MEELKKNLEEMGHTVHTIHTADWKFKDVFRENTLVLFDTLTGFGEFGEQKPEEIKKEKYINAIGIVICWELPKLAVAVIPKYITNKETIACFIKTKQECTGCFRMKEHVKIFHQTGDVFCMDCMEIVTKFL